MKDSCHFRALTGSPLVLTVLFHFLDVSVEKLVLEVVSS